MFEELCWINTFIKSGAYEPNWGARYFAELVNPIPRVLWHNKPLIGIDYAKARGLGSGGDNSGNAEAGVYATVSTGLIGYDIGAETRGERGKRWVLNVLPLVLSVVLMLIADLDTPRTLRRMGCDMVEY